jgi:hypothetical protein
MSRVNECAHYLLININLKYKRNIIKTFYFKKKLYSKNNENVTCLRFLRKKIVSYEKLRKLTKILI